MNFPWAVIVKGMAISLALTLILELIFALLWGVRSRHDLQLAVLVNVLTNPIVVFTSYFLILRRLPANRGLATLFLEAFAVITEAMIYKKHAQTIDRPWIFSLSINAFSYSAGELINQMRGV